MDGPVNPPIKSGEGHDEFLLTPLGVPYRPALKYSAFGRISTAEARRLVML